MIQTAWPFQRDAIDDVHSLLTSDGSSILNCWKHAQSMHQKARRALEQSPIPGLRTIFVSGSLGRMETVSSSDCDFVIVPHDSVVSETERQRIVDEVFGRLESAGIITPKRGGIFAVPSSVADLCAVENIGVVDESLVTFGQRIQCLLDGQPLFNVDEYEKLQIAILQRFSNRHEYDPDQRILPTGTWAYLIDDLIRYQRSFSVRVRWGEKKDAAEFVALNTKFDHSRLMNFVGLLGIVISASPMADDGVSHFQKELRKTPLERVLTLFPELDSRKVVTAYDAFLEAASENRLHQVRESPVGGLRSLFARAIFQRMHDLPASVLESLLL